MVSAHPNTLDHTRQPPKLGDFFSPYQHQQQQPSIISSTSPFNDNINSINNGYENFHRPQSVTSLPLRQQQQQQNQNNILSRQSQQNRRSPLMNATNNPQFVNSLGGRLPPQSLMSSSPTGPISQEQMMQNRINSQQQGQNPKNPKLYKTELCRSWMDHGRCNYGERCQYAHGDTEKRPIPRHPKYKTDACSSYHKTGYCPYGPRCHFIHNEEPAVLRQLIAQNAAAMQTVGGGSEQSSPTLTPTTQRPRNLNLQQTMSAPPSTVATPMQQQQQQLQNQRQHSNILPIGSRPSQQQTPTPTTPNQQQQYFVMQQQQQKLLGSDGESPIPSSTTDSGSESPLGSFSPGLDLDESALCRLSPNSFHRSLSQTGVPKTMAGALAASRWSPTSGMIIPNFSNSNIGITTSAAVASSNNGNNVIGIYGNNCSNDPWSPSNNGSSMDSPLIHSLTNLSFGESNNDHHQQQHQQQIWESSPNHKVSSPCRLPVFERLSNNL